MKSPRPLAAALVLSLVTAAASAQDAKPAKPAKLERVFAKLRLTNPLFLTHPRDGTDRIFVLEQGTPSAPARVLWFENRPDVESYEVALDLGRKVRSGGEEGLLGMAFHPKFKDNGVVFLHYTWRDMPRRGVVVRYKMDAERKKIDPASEEIVLVIPQPWANHNGGSIEFNPTTDEPYLYVALGDGGSGNDPLNAGQKLDTILGKILRIDVDHPDPTIPGLKYGIPKDNPFVGKPGVRGEIWAYGLRNPWRISFDRKTGDLWAGDVGQGKWEEIDLIVKGGNYGWRLREGAHDFNPVKTMPSDLIDPVAEHGRGEAVSITGGYVYRGKQVPALEGRYVYGDFGTGLIWTLKHEPGQTAKPEFLIMTPAIASFGEDRDGELYVVSLGGYIHKFVKTSE